ncbi:NAD-dependent epimerase/dehydratase family protein [Brachybacterium paraconglomeratum]|uniref:NAD-dependent epimerase/dehydratase family protein n=1 Tax=Brachybacterium paraconglomeratum TaxID=173362 RepID=UPI00249169B3|nr:NAD-dependent epimerase/dehydratase family protein [Brachybacterium paraconglomeratum]
MHHLVIGEGQIGRAIIERALADGDTVTVLRRTAKDPSPGIRRVAGDVLDPAALGAAIDGAGAVHATFHAPYDARLWREQLPPRELAVLDAAAGRGIPVVFPESFYGYQGGAAHLAEDASPSPQDEKGRVRVELLAVRRAHRARTLSVIASDLIGPSTVGTGAAVATAMVIEPLLTGRRAILFGRADAPHTLTHVPDLAAAMLHAARRAEHLTGAAGDAVLNAPAAPARTQRELIAEASRLVGLPARRPIPIPRAALTLLTPFNTFARELHGISGLWYGPCVQVPGRLEREEGLVATSWEDAVGATVRAAQGARDTGAVSVAP